MDESARNDRSEGAPRRTRGRRHARTPGEEPTALAARAARLDIREQAELALRLPPGRRIELLLQAPRPMRLVRALPDADLYLTVRELGPADAMPLLALASAGQLVHLIDLEAWRIDRFDAQRAGAWIALLLDSGEATLLRFLRRADDELLTLLFHGWMRLEQIDSEDTAEVHGHGEGEAGTERGLLAPDGNHRFDPVIAEHAPAVGRILHLFYRREPDRYRRILWDSIWELPSETEERALQWRQSRLEEHGFPDWEEALAVYAAPTGATEHPLPPEPSDPDGLGASRGPLMVLPPASVLLPALDRLREKARDRVLFEMISVANRLLIADAADTGDPAAHRRAIAKAAGYIGVALEARGAGEAAATARVLERVPALELFREGYARAVELQARARRLTRPGGWAAGCARALELLDSPIRERVEGLLHPRPLYLELGSPRAALRDFATLAELEETRVALETAETLGELLVTRLGLDLSRVLAGANAGRAEPCRFSTLLLTLLAWNATRHGLRCEPLPPPVCADFLRSVASRRTAGPEAPARALERLMRDVSRAFDLDARRLSVLRAYGRFCLERLADECAGLDPGVPPERGMISCLIVE